MQTAYTYDRSGRATRVVHANWRHWVIRYDYALDEAGNRTAVTESIRAPFLSYLPIVLRGPQRTTAEPIAAQEPGPDDPVNGTMEPAPAPTLPEFGERVVSHTYDSRSQLTRTAYRGDWGFTVTEIEYTYDSRGNLSRKQVTAGTVVTTESTFDRADQISTVDGRSHRYDARGNLIDDGVFTYTYDALDRMIEARSLTTTAVYTYNGDGLRIAQGIDGEETRFTWDPALGLPQLVAGSDGTRYLQGLGLEGVQQGDGAWRYPLPDLLGSVRQWSDAAGGVVATADYDPFGNLLSRTGDRPAPIGFAGEWEDAATGLQYLRARWYSPAQARFTQVDPFPGIPTLPGSQHPYSYVLNNPVNYTDPSGEIAPIVVAILIGGLIGAAAAGGSYAWNHRDLSGCEPFNDSDFWAAVASGFVGGAVGAALGFFIPAPGLIGAVVAGALGGGIAAGVERIVWNAMTGAAWDNGLGDSILGGMIGGAIGGAIGYGFGRLLGGGGCPGGICETGPECFPAGTQVATQDGTESIETIAVGERVLAKDPKTGETGYYPVTEVFSHTADALVELTIAGEVVSATLEHPFRVQNRGWVAAGGLRPGDCVESAAGVCREVERTRVVPGSITVYNFKIYDIGVDNIGFIGKDIEVFFEVFFGGKVVDSDIIPLTAIWPDYIWPSFKDEEEE